MWNAVNKDMNLTNVLKLNSDFYAYDIFEIIFLSKIVSQINLLCIFDVSLKYIKKDQKLLWLLKNFENLISIYSGIGTDLPSRRTYNSLIILLP